MPSTQSPLLSPVSILGEKNNSHDITKSTLEYALQPSKLFVSNKLNDPTLSLTIRELEAVSTLQSMACASMPNFPEKKIFNARNIAMKLMQTNASPDKSSDIVRSLMNTQFGFPYGTNSLAHRNDNQGNDSIGDLLGALSHTTKKNLKPVDDLFLDGMKKWKSGMRQGILKIGDLHEKKKAQASVKCNKTLTTYLNLLPPDEEVFTPSTQSTPQNNSQKPTNGKIRLISSATKTNNQKSLATKGETNCRYSAYRKASICPFCVQLGLNCGRVAAKCPNRPCSKCNRRHRLNRCKRARPCDNGAGIEKFNHKKPESSPMSTKKLTKN